MKLKDILKNSDYILYGDENIEITNLSHNSKEVKEGGVFFAINGENVNGEEFVVEAEKHGAKVVVSEKKLDTSLINVVVKDVRKAMSLMASEFYNKPAEKMFIIGVTGTNGKTTTTYMLKNIFEKAGKKVGVIGTNGIIIDNKKYSSFFTTPDPILLQEMLHKMQEQGVNVVCMEISAHALELQKIWGVMSDIALFTNLTQDHLDYFKNMENYFQAKCKLFTKDHARFGVVNIDDPYGKIIFENAEIPIVKISRVKNSEDCHADIFADNIQHNNSNQEFDVSSVKGNFHVKLNMLGNFNVSNALGAISAAIMAGVDTKTIVKAFEELEMVDGRFNTVMINGIKFIVDYAHTPDGLENILKAAREITQGKLISVFGCGGNRDKTKRAIMGKISTDLSDITIITSDNPRTEKPRDIISDIEKGCDRLNYLVVEDRVKAIKETLKIARCGDTVVLLGKGSEKYFDVNNEKIPYVGDLEVVKEIKKHTEKVINEAILL